MWRAGETFARAGFEPGVAQAVSFHGVGFSLQGDKNRFVLPPTFRKLVKDASAGSRILCVAKHDRWPCLTGFGTSRLDAFIAQVEREETFAMNRQEPYDAEQRLAQLSTFEHLAFDDSGRFVLPDYLTKQAGLTGQAYFNGNGPFFTIWNPAALMGMGPGWEPMQAACVALGAEAHAAKAKRS